MRFYGGLKPEDWTHWGQFSTVKSNAAELMEKTVREWQIIYCSPLVDPYQPIEEQARLMPGVLRTAIRNPPRVFVIQTRSPLIMRDLAMLVDLAGVTKLRVSFSVTTDREDVRRRYEPHCESNDRRLETIERLRVACLEVYATLAPILPCDPECLVRQAILASRRNLIADPPHVRLTKSRGATTRAAALEIAERFGEAQWFDPKFQDETLREMTRHAARYGFELSSGTKGFGLLACPA